MIMKRLLSHSIEVQITTMKIFTKFTRTMFGLWAVLQIYLIHLADMDFRYLK